MAQAGFFYHGYVDQVSCFHCGVDLNGWKLHDDPWTEHAAHAGECPFLNEMKTRDFIETAIMRRDFSMQSRTENYVANALHKFDQDLVLEAIHSLEDPITSAAELHEEVARHTNKTCCICSDRAVQIVFQPCNHLAACDKCSKKCHNCPICRAATHTKLRVFVSW
jgi:baculoviral IAP repeat-containing protein 7/8